MGLLMDQDHEKAHGHPVHRRDPNSDVSHVRADPRAVADWKAHGVKVIPGHALDPNTAQTPGMLRAAAINRARVGAEKLWAGTVTIHANAKTGAHHHGDLER